MCESLSRVHPYPCPLASTLAQGPCPDVRRQCVREPWTDHLAASRPTRPLPDGRRLLPRSSTMSAMSAAVQQAVRAEFDPRDRMPQQRTSPRETPREQYGGCGVQGYLFPIAETTAVPTALGRQTRASSGRQPRKQHHLVLPCDGPGARCVERCASNRNRCRPARDVAAALNEDDAPSRDATGGQGLSQRRPSSTDPSRSVVHACQLHPSPLREGCMEQDRLCKTKPAQTHGSAGERVSTADARHG